ncbi:MAG: ABC transporter ATP-binding protein [Bacteriovoracia bacterium]
MKTAVKVNDLSVRFGEFYAVKHVSFEVAPGEIFGFLGANGAGKTTTIRVLCGLLVPSAGRVEVAGEGFSDGGLRLKSKVGYMSQKFTLYDDLTVEENLAFTARLRKLDTAEFNQRRTELLKFIDFQSGFDTLVRDLPGGIKQQVSLVASLIHDPEVVFLDEPTAGVTPAYRARFWELIRELANQGRTVFVTTHYMDEAEQCGRIALMRSGELIALDRPEALKLQVFPRGLLQLDPQSDSAREVARRLKNDPRFTLFQPYGMRFHAELSAEVDGGGIKRELGRDFLVREIRPTLEDVFIRLVEGSQR